MIQKNLLLWIKTNNSHPFGKYIELGMWLANAETLLSVGWENWEDVVQIWVKIKLRLKELSYPLTNLLSSGLTPIFGEKSINEPERHLLYETIHTIIHQLSD
jgi:hypothetical protein